ncbi:MAG: asparagine synthase (glutamine-hydrolyzing) [Ignavibacteriota bacterium]|nr:asparagine synthase (glutamine-hydrolyzing) [Ignavibacteriota bacterium]
MCGIVGLFSTNGNISVKDLISSAEMVKYRGPDDEGYMFVRNDDRILNIKTRNEAEAVKGDNIKGGFAFRRLSILDLSESGHQPMSDDTENFWIIYNGEIYNYLELRSELQSLGYHFKSMTDTEVIIYSFIEWGSKCLEKFNGMWSFALYDKSKRRLFCSVDRFGIKPLYYNLTQSTFAFASEIKQVINVSNLKPRVNDKVLFDYLSAGSYGNETKETFFKDIIKLLPGTYLEVTLSESGIKCSEKEWWKLEVKDEFYKENDINTISGNIKELFYDSVRIRLRSDVEIGTCLSGGLDSSGIVCVTNDITNGQEGNKLFTIVSGESENLDYKYSKVIADYVKGNHIIRRIDKDESYSDLRKFIWHNDEPLIKASMFGGYKVYQLAKENNVKVVFDGQGLDEYAGGYYQLPYIEYMNYLKKNKSRNQFKNHIDYLIKEENYTEQSLTKALNMYNLKKALHKFTSKRLRLNLLKSVKGWFNRDFLVENIRQSQLYNSPDIEDARISKDDVKLKNFKLFKHINLPGILRQVDRNSMAFSVEARVPFLDHRLVEYIFSLKSEYILHNGYTKYAYREAMKGVIPEEVRNRRDKVGFYIDEYSLVNSMKDNFREMLADVGDGDKYYNRNYIIKKLDENSLNVQNYDNILWRIMNALTWKREFNINHI